MAENHENLHHVLVFFTVTGIKAGTEVQAEILPPFPDHNSDGGDHLIIKAGPHFSLPLMLPAHTTPGPKDVRMQSGYYEIKLLTLPRPSSTPPEYTDNSTTPLLDAAQLTSIHPTSYLCASCSLPLIQSTKINVYRDLPSEHWEELVDAWMCHADQKLHDHVAKRGKSGFWPSAGEGLVGGSYILFDRSAMNQNNLHLAKDSKVCIFYLFSFSSFLLLLLVVVGQKEDWRWLQPTAAADHVMTIGINPLKKFGWVELERTVVCRWAFTS